MAFWKAAAHQFGPGKIHIIHPEDGAKTLCGVKLKFCPGEPVEKATPTCLACARSLDAQEERKAWNEKYERESQQRKREQEERNQQWWAQYNAYLQSPEWAKRRTAVLKRANSICEACGENRATRVQHTSWQHIFHQPLFELVAICSECQEQLRELDRGRLREEGYPE